MKHKTTLALFFAISTMLLQSCIQTHHVVTVQQYEQMKSEIANSLEQRGYALNGTTNTEHHELQVESSYMSADDDEGTYITQHRLQQEGFVYKDAEGHVVKYSFEREEATSRQGVMYLTLLRVQQCESDINYGEVCNEVVRGKVDELPLVPVEVHNVRGSMLCVTAAVVVVGVVLSLLLGE